MKQFICIQLPFWLWLAFCALCFLILPHPSCGSSAPPFPGAGGKDLAAVGMVTAMALGVVTASCIRSRRERNASPADPSAQG